jgi:hypothetical protein
MENPEAFRSKTVLVDLARNFGARCLPVFRKRKPERLLSGAVYATDTSLEVRLSDNKI